MLYLFVLSHVFNPKPVPTFGRHALVKKRGKRGAVYRPSRYHMLPKTRSRADSARKPENSGRRLTLFNCVSEVSRRPIQSLPLAARLPLMAVIAGTRTALSPLAWTRWTEPPVASASGFRRSTV